MKTKLTFALIGLCLSTSAKAIVIIINPNPPAGYPTSVQEVVTGLNSEMDGIQHEFPAAQLHPVSLGYRHALGDNFQEEFALYPVTPFQYSGPWQFSLLETNGPDETMDGLLGVSDPFLWNGQTDVPWAFINDNMNWSETTDGVDFVPAEQPDNFSVSAVPEPSLAVVLLGGLLLKRGRR